MSEPSPCTRRWMERMSMSTGCAPAKPRGRHARRPNFTRANVVHALRVLGTVCENGGNLDGATWARLLAEQLERGAPFDGEPQPRGRAHG